MDWNTRGATGSTPISFKRTEGRGSREGQLILRKLEAKQGPVVSRVSGGGHSQSSEKRLRRWGSGG